MNVDELDPELTANVMLSHHRIVSKLDAGGIGEVYLPRHQLARGVAIEARSYTYASGRPSGEERYS